MILRKTALRKHEAGVFKKIVAIQPAIDAGFCPKIPENAGRSKGDL